MVKILSCRCLFVAFVFSFMSVSALAAEEVGIYTTLDNAIGVMNGFIATIFFFDVLFFVDGVQLPFMVAWLAGGALFFTFRLGFVNIRAFTHAIACVRGKYSRPEDKGEVSHFQALSMALSATVGLGNIAGVAIAISIGGPGATFWMMLAGFLGMTSKFAESTLAQVYREIRPDGHVMGGAMEYLSRGFKEKGLPKLGKFLAILFCFLCVGASLGGGNAFQVSQALGAVKQSLPFFMDQPFLFGLIMAGLVGIVIIGGVKRIANTAQAIVPLMVVIYISAALWIIFSHFSEVPGALGQIVSEAFSPEAGLGGLIGVLIIGFQRAAFSNEAGIGSAAIAHSTARTPYPAREGIVSLLEPFIDTIVVCTMTALVIIITGAYNNPDYASLIEAKQGAALTSQAFGSVISWFPLVLSACVVLFAYSTMIAWSYYGERCWAYVFGERYSIVYRITFVGIIVVASITSASNILDFSDLLLLSMAFPNFIGLYVMQDKIRFELNRYMAKLYSGELDREVGRS